MKILNGYISIVPKMSENLWFSDVSGGIEIAVNYFCKKVSYGCLMGCYMHVCIHFDLDSFNFITGTSVSL